MSNTNGEYDEQYWNMFAEMLLHNGCPQDKADEIREGMLQPRKRKFGDLTVKELWEICHAHPQCEDCPLGNDLCMAFLWQRPEGVLKVVVDL